jgi:hypothetical protein
VRTIQVSTRSKVGALRLPTVLWGLAACLFVSDGHCQAWRNCVPNSIGPGGCDSIGPGGGQSIGPGGGLSIGPGGGLSIGPGGGQSIGPGGGQSIGPGGGQSLGRDRSRGLDPDTLRPYSDAATSIVGRLREDVLKSFGAPQRLEANGALEAWHYCRTGETVDKFVAVIFHHGTVIGARRYEVTAEEAGTTGHCSLFARSVLAGR